MRERHLVEQPAQHRSGTGPRVALERVVGRFAAVGRALDNGSRLCEAEGFELHAVDALRKLTKSFDNVVKRLGGRKSVFDHDAVQAVDVDEKRRETSTGPTDPEHDVEAVSRDLGHHRRVGDLGLVEVAQPRRHGLAPAHQRPSRQHSQVVVTGEVAQHGEQGGRLGDIDGDEGVDEQAQVDLGGAVDAGWSPLRRDDQRRDVGQQIEGVVTAQPRAHLEGEVLGSRVRHQRLGRLRGVGVVGQMQSSVATSTPSGLPRHG